MSIQFCHRGTYIRNHSVQRVALAVEKNEAFNPVDAGLLGLQTVVFQTDLVAERFSRLGGSVNLSWMPFRFHYLNFHR